MTEYSIPKEINDFYSSVANQSLIRKVERTTFFDIINKSRREDVHSNFLKWIFMLDKLPCPDALMPVNSVVKDYAETHSQRDVENAFNGKGIRNNLEVIYNEGNLPKDKSRYSQEKIKCSGGKSIWCTNQWIPVVADKFIAEAESLGYTIKKL